MMLAAIYGRVSTDKQSREGMSIDRQFQMMRDWADQHGHKVAEVFEEPGVSAYEHSRPVFNRMIEAALSPERPFDILVFHSQSRFFRDNVERAVLKRKLDKLGIQVAIVSTPMPDDKNAAYLLENTLGIIDEFQSRQNSQNVYECQRTNAQRGFFNGSRPPYGYVSVATDVPSRSGRKKKLQIQKDEADVVRRIFSLAEFGENGTILGAKRIVARLNKDGVLHRGTKWKLGQIERILKNRIYIGEYITFRRESRTQRERPPKEWITVQVPAILEDCEQFTRVQSALAARRPENYEAKAMQVQTLLTGLLVCAKCGKKLTLMTGKSGRYQYYRCATKQKIGPGECDCPNLPKEEVETEILQLICGEILVPVRVHGMLKELKEKWAATVEPDRRKLLRLHADAASLESQVAALYGQVSTGALQMEDSLKTFIESLQRKLYTTRENLRQLKGRMQLPFWKFGPQQLDDFIASARAALSKPSNPHARAFLLGLVTSIKVSKVNLQVLGNRAQLASSVSQWKQNVSASGVPRLTSDWCGWRGSNPRPLASEANTTSARV